MNHANDPMGISPSQTRSEREVPNVKYLWPGSHKIIPPFGVVQNYQYTALI
jgi:hypothetical protein